MPVLLHSSRNLPPTDQYDYWLAVTGSRRMDDPERILPDLPGRLESAFDNIAETWWQLARAAGETTTAEYSYALVCSPIASDLGLMLAWTRLVSDVAKEDRSILVICDDPWLFRQLAQADGVQADAPPRLWGKHIKGRLRGQIARTALAVRLAVSSFITRQQRHHHKVGGAYLLVYGHPASTNDGQDVYFGDLMRHLPEPGRLLHTDCPPARAATLAEDGRTASLHAWGRWWFPFGQLFKRWRLAGSERVSEYGWLLRRAESQEGSGAGHAMTAWTQHCLENWVRDVRPSRLAWPWENLPWERLVVRLARQLDVETVGYQHADVGAHQYNMNVAGNPDGVGSIPDRIVLNGKGYRDQLIRWGLPEDRIVEGGAFRTAPDSSVRFDPKGPVYVALSGVLSIARQMLAIISSLKDCGIEFLIKEHPMYPIEFEQTETMKRTTQSLAELPAARAVVYATGMSGLDALLAGLPTFRLMMDDQISIDSLPAGCPVISVDGDGLVTALQDPEIPTQINWADLFSPADFSVWRDVLIPQR